MTDSLFSPIWYRVAELHPKLAEHVRVQRHVSRDVVWHVLSDDASGQQVRINEAGFAFVGLCDGQRTVTQIWDLLLEQLTDSAPTQNDIVHVLMQLGEHEMIVCEFAPDVAALFKQRQRRNRVKRRGWFNPLAFRVPLGDPTRLLDRIEAIAPHVFNRLALLVWVLLTGAAGLVAATYWSELIAHATTAISTPRYLLLAWVCFPFIKALHELGHALAVRRWGGEVHEMGTTLLVLVPAPYVDASAANAFRSRRQRIVVSAVGIMVELSLAAIALFVWLLVQPGAVRDMALVVMMIGALSTLVFNANPLLRFDGYYVLIDALDLPNLASRSRTFWVGLLSRRLGDRRQAAAMELARGERKWVLSYAPVSFAYRLFISAAIALWAGSVSAVFGWLASALLLFTALVMPGWTLARELIASVPVGKTRRRARLVIAGALAGLAAALLLIPLPFATVAPGVVWLPEQARVRAETDGFITEIYARDGAQIEPGQSLLLMSDPTLAVQQEKLQSRLSGLYAEQYGAMASDLVRAQHLAEDIARNQAELARIEERIEQLHVRSPIAGRLVMPRQHDLPGRFARQGEMLGYVLTPMQLEVRAAVAGEDATLVRDGTRRVDVLLVEDAARREAVLNRDLPAATFTLPSPALGDRGGGAFVTDPADKDGVRTLEPVFIVDVAVPGRVIERVGGRAWVRFDHGAQPLALQWYRRARQLFLKHFNPTA